MNILMITTCYPPVNVSGSIISLYYSNYMAELGHKVVVLTPDFPKSFSNYDSSLLQKINEDKVKVYRTSLGKAYSKLYRKKENNINNNSSSNISNPNKNLKMNVKKLLKDNIAIPDSYVIWANLATKKAIDIIKNENIDIIVSMHETPSSHLVALNVKKKMRHIRWTAYWSDPWTLDPLRTNHSNIREFIERKMEKNVVELADKHLFTTQSTREMYIQKFGICKKNTDVVYRGYDKKLLEEIENEAIPYEVDKSKINILHAGEIFTKLRDINPLIRAIKKLKYERKDIYDKLNIILLGNIDNIDAIEDISEISNFKILPRKSFKEALTYMNYSDVLLLFGNKNSNQMPAKIYDYIGLDKIMFTILGDEKDPIIDFISENNIDKGPVILNDEEDIYESIKLIYDTINQNNKNWIKPSSKFEWTNVVEDMIRKL